MDSELRALCEAAHRCNTWAREFTESYSKCDDAPRETEGFLPDYWGCGSRARTKLLNAERRLDRLRNVVREFSNADYDDAWACIERAVSADPPQRYVVGDETYVIAHEAAFAQAEYVLSSASRLGLTAIVDEIGLKDCFETIRTTAEQFRTIKFDDLRALIRRESVRASEIALTLENGKTNATSSLDGPDDDRSASVEPDGPCEPDGFRYRGKELRGLKPIAYRLIKLLWQNEGKAQNRTQYYNDEILAKEVWGEKERWIERGLIDGHAKQINGLFLENEFHLWVRVEKDKVILKELTEDEFKSNQRRREKRQKI